MDQILAQRSILACQLKICWQAGVNAHQRMMSGSSFAVPKLTAYVICIANAAGSQPPNGESTRPSRQNQPDAPLNRQQAMGCFYRIASLTQPANHIGRMRRPRSKTKSRCLSALHYRLNRLMLYPCQCWSAHYRQQRR